MREKLIQILGLAPVAGPEQSAITDDQILQVVAEVKSRADAADAAAKLERATNDLIRESCGAINRDTARQLIAERAALAQGKPD